MTEDDLALRPLAISGPADRVPGARTLAGGMLFFSAVEAIVHDEVEGYQRASIALDHLHDWARSHGRERPVQRTLNRLSAPRPPFAGLSMDRPQIMGIINVTPDSFSDGGDRLEAGRAIEEGLAMHEAGAALLDVGGESTRPGSDPVPEDEELRRILPVIEALAGEGCLVSVDTRRPGVMREAVAAGARIINDVTALSGDEQSLATAASLGVPVVLMHMQGEPKTMQRQPRYSDAAAEIYQFLASRLVACEKAGIAPQNVCVDPGIGFGKSLTHNLQLLDQIALFHGLGVPVLLGASRKSFIGKLSYGEPPKQRVSGSLAAAVAAAERGVQIMRVHDVAETHQALAVWEALTCRAGEERA
ncbi:MAG: dihydropteroate synthase [Rhodovibrionaceae bacterium]|nr:dihydropteroate synthase [Rhodovibrionaceae bacterium]